MYISNSKIIPLAEVSTRRLTTKSVLSGFLNLSARICVSGVLVISLCHAENSPANVPSSQNPASLSSGEGSARIAEINGDLVLKSDVDTELERPEMLMLATRLRQDPEYEKKSRITALMSIISRRLLADAAKKSESAKNPVVQSAVERFIQSQGGKEKLMSILELHKVSWEKFISDITEGITIKEFVEKEVVKDVVISDESVKSVFDKNPSMFDLPEQISARHILFRDREGAGSPPQKRAEIAIKEINSGSVSFESYAEKFSDDKVTANKGGALGFFSRGSMVPEFETAAFALNTSAISGPVRTSYGIHLIKVDDRKEGIKATFENSRERIRNMLLTESRAEVLNSYMQKLQEKASIRIIDPNYSLPEKD